MSNLNQLAALQNKYGSQGLIILAFPCNQFASQAQGTDDEFLRTLYYVRPGDNYTAPFPIFSGIDVNGAQAAPVFAYLTAACPQTPGGQLPPASYIGWDPLTTADLAWNFEKFLVRRNGMPFRRYATAVDPNTIEPDIVALLAQPA